MKYLGIVFLGVLLLLLEVLLATLGIALPLVAWGAFYLALLFRWYYASWYAIATGLVLGLLAGRELPTLILVIAIFALVGIYWHQKYPPGVLGAVTGSMTAGVCGGLAYLIDAMLAGAVISWSEAFFWWYFVAFAGAAIVPGAIFLLDWSLGLLPGYGQYYSEVKIKSKKPFSVVRSIKN